MKSVRGAKKVVRLRSRSPYQSVGAPRATRTDSLTRRRRAKFQSARLKPRFPPSRRKLNSQWSVNARCRRRPEIRIARALTCSLKAARISADQVTGNDDAGVGYIYIFCNAAWVVLRYGYNTNVMTRKRFMSTQRTLHISDYGNQTRHTVGGSGEQTRLTLWGSCRRRTRGTS